MCHTKKTFSVVLTAPNAFHLSKTSIFQRQFLMPQERKVHDVKWEKQDTVSYMQYDQLWNIYTWEKKTKENASFGCIETYRLKPQDTEPFCF